MKVFVENRLWEDNEDKKSLINPFEILYAHISNGRTSCLGHSRETSRVFYSDGAEDALGWCFGLWLCVVCVWSWDR